ncbi:hypothetical protein JOS77_04450 [Chromobacterium haemolyticum]|nr:hypothetical protein JOS77_04450 [Chromobacterium haemolyticum]
MYRTFIHTPADVVKVTVLPMGYNPNTRKELPRKDLQFSVQVSREQALEVAKAQLGVASLDDLVTAPGSEPALRDSWAPAMKEARAKTGKDSTPSSSSLAAALGAPV